MSPTLGPTTPLQTPSLDHWSLTSALTLPDPAQTVRHAKDVVLDARQYKTAGFAQEVLRLLAALRVASWTPPLSLSGVSIYKVSGSLTNAVFFISHAGAKTVLVRVYGPSSGELISRTDELHTLHVLSTEYGIGPRVYGTFGNGRVEEYFESKALTAGCVRDATISGWIGRRMAELHRVSVSKVLGDGSGEEAVRRNVRRWLGPAREVIRRARTLGREVVVDLDGFEERWEKYWRWLMEWEDKHGASERVFCHNDAQYGNLLRLKELRAGEPAHHRIIVVDFEYAGVNAAAFDIGNHFHEWTADYHGTEPHLLRRERYPDVSARRNFYGAYLREWLGRSALDEELRALEGAVWAWSAACDGMWGLWGIVQAGTDVEAGNVGEFDYLGYGGCRLSEFCKAVDGLCSRQRLDWH